MLARVMNFVEMNSVTVLVLSAVVLVLYVVARTLSARWPVALTFSTLPIIVFIFYTQNGGPFGAGMF
ncbi:hypothetical protein [Maritalea mediterranea]|uniref:Uncharacterized protein n=1 Tax=Maritalea mediterranea TaxID=2909667 RepID=A0ABS9E391_9HYPH|nr:hypothetical protein [Maritalea mediterranea]MCF4097343.1 hypothetical protein [Maritalea mediterranea]